MKEISPIELKNRLKNGEKITIIDVREPDECEICHISAINIPMGEIWQRQDEIPTDHDVVVHCKAGGRSAAVISALQDKNTFDNLINLRGGILAYAEEVDPSLEKY